MVLAFLLAVGVAYRLGVFGPFLPEAPEKPGGQPEPCELVRVVDGDTIVVLWRGNEERVRLLRVDTPERGMSGYTESVEFLRKFLTGKRIDLEFEHATPERDTLGRLLAYVYADGVNVNVEIVRAGWSPFWTKYGRGKYAELFEKAEAEAREGKRGLNAGQDAGSGVRRPLQAGVRRPVGAFVSARGQACLAPIRPSMDRSSSTSGQWIP